MFGIVYYDMSVGRVFPTRKEAEAFCRRIAQANLEWMLWMDNDEVDTDFICDADVAAYVGEDIRILPVVQTWVVA
jgi:hypothetical protein